MKENKNAGLWLVAIIAVKFILQYLLSGSGHFGLHRDEFLHLDQGKHLAWGYYSVPPFTSWLSWLILQLGNSFFLVKLVPAIFGALTIILVWKITEALDGGLYACVLATMALTLSSLLRFNLLYQPNSTEIFFWTLLYFTLIKYIRSESAVWLYAAAITVGLGFLNKYNIVFCLAGLVPALLLTHVRERFFNRHLLLAAALFLLVISPNIIWQVQNDFPVLKHMRELAETQLVHINRMDFVKEQLLFFVGALFILIAGYTGLFTFAPFKLYRFIFIGFVISMSLFIYLKAKGYYAYGLYPVYFALGSVYIEHILRTGWKRKLRAVPLILVTILFIPLLLFAFPIKSPAEFVEAARLDKPFSRQTWEDGKAHPISQDFADMLGWEELAAKTDHLYASLPDKENTLVLADNYGQAGAINYYSKFPGINAVSFNADYLNWFKLDQPVRNMVRIITQGDDITQRELQAFDSTILVGQVTNKYAREYGTKIWFLKGAKVNLNRVLKAEIEKVREGP